MALRTSGVRQPSIWASVVSGVASHLRWRIGEGCRFLVMMLGGGCDSFGGVGDGVFCGLGVE
jgi:hypothetical protein